MQPISDEYGLETCLAPSDEFCVLAYDILLICCEYGSKLTFHEILKFVYLHSINSLRVQYMN